LKLRGERSQVRLDIPLKETRRKLGIDGITLDVVNEAGSALDDWLRAEHEIRFEDALDGIPM
jgi:hypothetical protein